MRLRLGSHRLQVRSQRRDAAAGVARSPLGGWHVGRARQEPLLVAERRGGAGVTTRDFFELRKLMHAHYNVLRCPAGSRGARRILETGPAKTH
eukprot:6184970-Pleurochrysis_carterae.AAC.1